MLKYVFIACLIIQFGYCNICKNQDSNESGSQDINEPCFDLQPFEYNSNKKIQEDKSIELECYVKNKGSYYVAWLHDNQLISFDDKVIKPDSNIMIDSDSKSKFNLKITHIDSNHKGSYRCQISTLNAKNLEYTVEVLIPSSITRIPSAEIITLNEGDSLTVQCLTQGNPKPKLTWSKKGEKAGHTTIDDTKSTLSLQNVDESHSDIYSCTAKNGVGNPVTSEFQILIKFKPRVKFTDEENINKSVMYSTVGRKEQIKCLVDSYPAPKMSLLLNDVAVPSSSYTFEESKASNKQFILTYNFIGTADTFGQYTCIAENDLGISTSQIKVTPSLSEVIISNDKLPNYSDAIIFEWSVLSGSSIEELHVQIFSPNNSNGTSIVSKTKPLNPDGSEAQATYHNENIIYKDFYEITKLNANMTYVLRIKVRNQFEWSEWSHNLTVKTHPDENDKSTKHRSYQIHHHRQHHDRKHKNLAQQTGSRDLNARRDRLNSEYENSSFGINSLIGTRIAIISIITSIILNFF